jgi:predicted RecB family nuclease
MSAVPGSVPHVQLISGDDDSPVLVLSATDLTRFTQCRHAVLLDRQAAYRLLTPPPSSAADLDIVLARGLGHERAQLEAFRASVPRLVEIDVEPAFGPDGLRGTASRLRAAQAATEAAMAEGAGVIYQATFFDGRWRGHADFLIRSERPGRWAWSYDVADTKLARAMSVTALLQMASYGEALTVLQGVAPHQLTVITGDGRHIGYRYQDVAAYARRLRSRLLDFTADGLTGTIEPDEVAGVAGVAGAAVTGGGPPPLPAELPAPVPHCAQCRWSTHCRTQWRQRDSLHLVAGLRTRHVARLEAAGVHTVAELAAVTEVELLPLSETVRERAHRQARLQIGRRAGKDDVALLPAQPGAGLALLPEPSPGDVFFDMEGDPFVGDKGLEYLFGVVHRGEFDGFWALSPEHEKQAFEQLVDHLMAAWAADPGMHVYHYAPYEPTRLNALAGRYDTRTAEVAMLARGGRLVDLYSVVKQGLQVGTESYALKKLEPWFWPGHRTDDDVADAMGSVVAFERWLESGDDAVLENIRHYNEQDCRSTEALRDWLEQQRSRGGGEAAYPRPVPGDGSPNEKVAAAVERTRALVDRLLATLDPALTAALDQGTPLVTGEAVGSPGERATWLLSRLLDWHRREAVPQWGDWYRRKEAPVEALLHDPQAVAGLHSPVAVGRVRRSTIYRVSFPPQETVISAGAKGWSDPATGATVSQVLDVRADEGWLTLTRASSAPAPSAVALVPPGPPGTDELQRRLWHLAEWVLEHGITADLPGWRAARDLLLRRRPLGGRLRLAGEDAQQALWRLSLDLTDPVRHGQGRGDGVVLPVQGPPGTGKTYAGAAAILDLVAAGRRVGICAYSHAAIGTLVAEVVSQAAARGEGVRIMRKADPETVVSLPGVRVTGTNEDVEAAVADGDVDIVAGTAWLFARPALSDQLDVLVVDEAGQLSLANVVAVSGAARSLLLLGDPQQLAQPVVGEHPPGAGASALEHLLDGAATVPGDRGLLLDTTRRMHPAVAGYVSWLAYDERLASHDGCERQAIGWQGSASPPSVLGSGQGVRWVPVEHTGCGAASRAEAEVVAALVARLLAGGTWTDASGATQPLVGNDVLVLAAYNQQVHQLVMALRGAGVTVGPDGGAVRGGSGDGVRVGTVDRCQGQEAPVVLFSLATSSAVDAPRGLDFVLSPNRINVALSRARALAVVVGSPQLLDAPVSSPQRLRAVNALCALVETAEATTSGVAGLASTSGVAGLTRGTAGQAAPGR